MLPLPKIRPISEADVDQVLEQAGGRRAHADVDRRADRNSDYMLGRSIVELKLLEDERLEKPEAQAKIAELIGSIDVSRPVVVIASAGLAKAQKQEYDKIMRAPVKAAIRSARAQLKQTRSEVCPDATNVLLIINNGFTAMSHEDLVEHAVDRVRNDTNQIDAVVVAGCYLHGDGFDTFALWPIDCVAINEERPFREFEDLRRNWNALADRHMTEFVRGEHGEFADKEAQTDVVFDFRGRTYVKPAIPIGRPSKFFGGRRPRRNRVGFDQVKHTALTIPRLSQVEHRRIRAALPDEPLLESLEAWNHHIDEAMLSSRADRPVVPVNVTRGSWEAWKRKNPDSTGTESLRAHANNAFGIRASRIVHSAVEASRSVKLPSRYVWVIVELIGQDESNDVSHIGVFDDGADRVLLANARMGHFPALSLAAAYALKFDIGEIYWRHDLSHAWV